MDNIIIDNAYQFAKLVRAHKHIKKVLDEIDKKGRFIERLGATGVAIVINRGDALHLRYQTLYAEYSEKINTYHLTK